MESKTKVMLVEDHPEYREVINLALEEESDIELTNEFGSAERALRSLQDRTLRKEPDIILLDLNLPGLSGLEALPYFRSSLPFAKVIILTQSNKEADVFCGIRNGASGYLLKSSTLEEIVKSIRDVSGGGVTIDSAVAAYILTAIQDAPPKEQLDKNLSERELEILTLISQGLVKKEIGDKLKISINTVVSHIVHIYEKLEVNTAAAAVNRGHRLGLFTDD